MSKMKKTGGSIERDGKNGDELTLPHGETDEGSERMPSSFNDKEMDCTALLYDETLFRDSDIDRRRRLCAVV